MTINCPKCGSYEIIKNGHRRGKQNHQCKNCGRQFIEKYSQIGYSKEVKKQCLIMYLNCNVFRAIQRMTNVNHNTIMRWVKKTACQLPDSNNNDNKIPQVGEIDELQTFVGKKN